MVYRNEGVPGSSATVALCHVEPNETANTALQVPLVTSSSSHTLMSDSGFLNCTSPMVNFA